MTARTDPQRGSSCGRWRLRFDLPAESGFNRLVLGMRYDDGFEAWLNGAPLAASAGAGTHADDLALNREEWLLPAGLAALVLGDNVLAVRGVNAAVDDPTFLMVPELEGRVVTQQPEELRYFVVPTPGADNLVPEGTPEPPPLLDAPTVGGAGEVKFADTIPLQVTVVPTAAEIA